MRADDRLLADLAASVADGAEVNWTRAEEIVPTQQKRLVRHLKLVESIANLHRSIPDEDVGPDDSARAEPQGPRWGRLVLLERIGQGMSGDVHRAHDTELHRDVALKLLHEGAASDDAHRRVLEEARRLARIRHPHVVHVYGAERHDGRVGLWMELVAGESLEEMVRSRGRFSAQEAAMTGLDLCAALAAVHGAGLLHRDIKAQNVVREAGGRIVLMDFGTGEELREHAGSSRMVGTPLYLAPELFKGRPATVQTDIYSLGVLLFHLTTGEFPVKAGTMIELAKAHSKGQRRRLRDVRPDLPSAFVAAVERALDPDPAKRFASAGEMESALRQVLDVPKPAQIAQPVRTPGLRSRAGFVAVAAALLAVVVGLIVWATRGPAGEGADAGVRAARIAVLPLSNLSASTVAPYLADALTDELISTLGQIGGLQVSSMTSTKAYGDEKERPDIPTIGRELGVDHLLEGTVLAEAAPGGAPRVRVNVRLLAAGTGATVWTDTFQRELGDTFAIQSEIARAVANAVHVRLTETENSRLGRQRITNPAAEEAYLQGRVHLGDYGVAAATRALDAFQRAVQHDAAHAAAHAGIARALVRLGSGGQIAQTDARARAAAAARKALDLNPDLAEAHAIVADISFLYDWDLQGAEGAYRRSLDLNPSYTEARLNFAQVLSAQGRHDEALAQAEMAQQIDPQSLEALRTYALLLYYKRDYEEAERVAQRAVLQEPDSAGGLILQGRVAEARGRVAEALELTQRASALSAGGGVPLRVGIVRLQALAGHHSDAENGFNALVAEAAAGKIRLSARDLAYMHLSFGRTGEALRAFEKALAERDPSLVWLGVDPRVDSLRTNPRFQSILAALEP